MHPLYKLLADLDNAGVDYTLRRTRPDTVLVSLTLVGQRVEIDVFEDGHMEVARFHGSEQVLGGSEVIEQLIRESETPG